VPADPLSAANTSLNARYPNIIAVKPRCKLSPEMVPTPHRSSHHALYAP